jgi:hypothetical protein
MQSESCVGGAVVSGLVGKEIAVDSTARIVEIAAYSLASGIVGYALPQLGWRWASRSAASVGGATALYSHWAKTSWSRVKRGVEFGVEDAPRQPEAAAEERILAELERARLHNERLQVLIETYIRRAVASSEGVAEREGRPGE